MWVISSGLAPPVPLTLGRAFRASESSSTQWEEVLSPSLPHGPGYVNMKACNFKMQVVGWTIKESLLGLFEV